jgi:hypothetical protein
MHEGQGAGNDPTPEIVSADGVLQTGDQGVPVCRLAPDEGPELCGHGVRFKADFGTGKEFLHYRPVEAVSSKTLNKRPPYGSGRPDRSEKEQQKNNGQDKRLRHPIADSRNDLTQGEIDGTIFPDLPWPGQ